MFTKLLIVYSTVCKGTALFCVVVAAPEYGADSVVTTVPHSPGTPGQSTVVMAEEVTL